MTSTILDNVPTRVLKTFAKKHGIPSSVSPDKLRDLIKQSVPDAEVAADPLVTPYLSTQATQNYRFYQVEGTGPGIEILVDKIKKSTSGDPFGNDLRPPLTDNPNICHAEILEQNALSINIVFQGDPRIIQNGWQEVEVRSPIFARVIYRPDENLLEIRGRRHKIGVIEEWVRSFLEIPTLILAFNYEESMKLKELLSGKTYSVSRNPKSGKLGSIRLISSDAASDVEDDPATKEIGEVLGRLGGSDSTSPTLVFWDRTKVRPNERQGSFYIQKHVSENELSQLRATLQSVKGAGETPYFEDAAQQQPLRVQKQRELKADIIQGKINKVSWLTDSQRGDLLRVVLSLSLSQQHRLLPGFFANSLGISSEAAERLCKRLSTLGLLRPFEEAICYECGTITRITDGWEGKCIECDSDVDSKQQAYCIRGFIRPSMTPDNIFKADYIILRQLHNRLLASRESGSNDEKKKALEHYVAVLFEMITKVKCVNRDSLSSVDEIDLIFQNEHVGHALLKLMSPNFMALCRNTANPVDSKEMRAFKDSMKSRGHHYGVYVSVNGFTGFKQKGHGAQDCLQAIRDARIEGYRILTLDLSDLEQILEEGRSLVDILWEKNNNSLTY